MTGQLATGVSGEQDALARASTRKRGQRERARRGHRANDPVGLAPRRKQAAVAPRAFDQPNEQEAIRAQRMVQVGQDPVLEIRPQIDPQVTA